MGSSTLYHEVDSANSMLYVYELYLLEAISLHEHDIALEKEMGLGVYLICFSKVFRAAQRLKTKRSQLNAIYVVNITFFARLSWNFGAQRNSTSS